MNNKLAAFKMPQKQSMSAFANIPRQTEIMGQPHMLSYINPEEEAMLQQMRGGMPPLAGPGGVPAFWSLSGWANDTFGTSFGDGSGGVATNNPNDNNTVTVTSGNTLSQIAEDNNMSVAEIMADNPDITNPDQIQAGQVLDLSGAGSGSSTYDGGVGLGGIGSGSNDDPVVTTTTYTGYDDLDGALTNIPVSTYTDTSSISGISNASGNLGVENDAGTTLTLADNGSFYITDASAANNTASNCIAESINGSRNAA